eukprot:2463438-Pyramimonas_sp.AAC.1
MPDPSLRPEQRLLDFRHNKLPCASLLIITHGHHNIRRVLPSDRYSQTSTARTLSEREHVATPSEVRPARLLRACERARAG